MLDDFLKDDEDTATFLDQLEEDNEFLDLEEDSDYGFLGMTAGQRLVILLMLFFLVLIASAFCLLITGAVAIPNL